MPMVQGFSASYSRRAKYMLGIFTLLLLFIHLHFVDKDSLAKDRVSKLRCTLSSLHLFFNL